MRLVRFRLSVGIGLERVIVFHRLTPLGILKSHLVAESGVLWTLNHHSSPLELISFLNGFQNLSHFHLFQGGKHYFLEAKLHLILYAVCDFLNLHLLITLLKLKVELQAVLSDDR